MPNSMPAMFVGVIVLPVALSTAMETAMDQLLLMVVVFVVDLTPPARVTFALTAQLIVLVSVTELHKLTNVTCVAAMAPRVSSAVTVPLIAKESVTVAV